MLYTVYVRFPCELSLVVQVRHILAHNALKQDSHVLLSYSRLTVADVIALQSAGALHPLKLFNNKIE